MLHQVGIGTLGPVFRTYEPTRDRLVAVKVFRLDIVPEQAQALSLALTRATESALFHPSIVEPIGAGMEGTVAYRAEEYVAAESLDVAMRHYAPAPIDKALPFITQLAGAIDFARAAGVGHGGLHPRDIFVTPDEARATGFGVVEALEEVGIRAPTRRPYAAPERINGAAWSTPADVFSLAAIAFELLTARRPAGTGAQIGSLPEGEHSAAIHAVLARAMHDDPSERYSSALAFAAALEAAGHGKTITGSVAAPAAAGALAIADAPEPVEPLEPVKPLEPVESLASLDPTPGEFEVEKGLDPVLTALDDDIATERELDEADHEERRLFDAAALPLDAPEAEDVAAERFADEFVVEQEAQAEARRPLEAVHETVVPIAGPPMFSSSAHETYEPPETSRPAILPFTLVGIICLLIGFGGGYWMRDRQASSPTSAPAQASAAPTGPATSVTPGQYSEQRVAPPATSSAASSPAASAPAGSPPATRPPVPDETASATRSAPAARPPATPATPAATRGRLVVRSTPPRAGVTINGNWRGRTPLTIDDLPFGRHVIRVVQPGYAVVRQDLTFNAGNASQEFNARLERSAPAVPPPAARPTAPAPAAAPEVFTGTLYVDSRPRGATVFVDGRAVGVTPLSLPDVAIGSHIVRFEMAGKKTWTTSTRVVAGQTARVTGSLEDR